MKTFTAIIFLVLFTAGANGLAPHKAGKPVSRSDFLSSAAATTAAAFVAAPAWAAGIKDANLQNYEEPANAKTCVDRCVYECVKGGKGKADCQKDCSAKCADAKGQLTSNTPPTKKGSE